MSDKILGLDIGDTTIKAVQIEGGLRGLQVTACAEVGIPPDGGLKQAMDQLFEQVPINGASCVTALSSDRVSFRNMTLPFKDRKKIEQTIGFELEPLLPFTVDSVTTTYVAFEGDTNTPLLAACIKDEIIEEHLALLREYTFDPDIVEVGDAAVTAQLKKQEAVTECAVLLDIGGEKSSLTLMQNQTTVLIRSLHFGGTDVTRAIADAQKVDFSEAEALKKSADPGQFSAVVKPLVASFCREINNTLHAFRSQISGDAIPDTVFLTGGGALFPDLPALLEEELGLSVELLDLGAQINITFNDAVSENWSPLVMNNALALALRDGRSKNSFNFRSGRFKKQKRYDQLRGELKRIMVYVSAVLFIFCAQFGADYYVLKKQKDHLDREIKSVFAKYAPDVKRIVNPVHQMKIKIREAKESMSVPDVAVGQNAAVDILRDITLRIPKEANLEVSTLVIDQERARLKGLTDTFNTVDEIKNGVLESGLFRDVTIASAQQDRTTNRIRFELVMVLK